MQNFNPPTRGLQPTLAQDAERLFDLFLSAHPLMPLYLGAVAICAVREELLACEVGVADYAVVCNIVCNIVLLTSTGSHVPLVSNMGFGCKQSGLGNFNTD